MRVSRFVLLAALLLSGLPVGLLMGCQNSQGLVGSVETSSTPSAPKPNIVFILTDDQDTRSLSPQRMPAVARKLQAKGTTFERFFLTDPWCCPSRASMLTGKYTHNHGIWGNVYPEGGARLFAQKDLDSSTIATRLDGEGYRTGLVGKYMNDYGPPYVPPGWDEWIARAGEGADPFALNQNGEVAAYPDRHPDAVISRKALSFVRESGGDAPFFAWVSFEAPHAPAEYQRAYAKEFSDARLPESPAFNEPDVSDKPGWVKEAPRLTAESVSKMEATYRDRLRSLQTVDEFVSKLVARLADSGELSNTYIVFTTDNGWQMGDHRLRPSKQVPYDGAASFPLVVRGPGVAAGSVRQELVANTDLAPTFADLAGAVEAEADASVDGRSFAPLLGDSVEDPLIWRDALLLEGVASKKVGMPPYRAIRTEDALYVEYETGEKEYYRLDEDPYQLESRPSEVPPALVERLDALKDCAAESCRAAENP